MMIAEIRKHTKCKITLGSENPEAWIKSGLKTAKSKDFYHKLK